MCRSAQRSIVGHSSPTTQHSSPTYPPAHISLHVCSYLPVYHVQAVAGDHAYLPCDIATVDDPHQLRCLITFIVMVTGHVKRLATTYTSLDLPLSRPHHWFNDIYCYVVCVPVYHVQAVAGDHAYLPCDIATVDDPQGNPDSVILVLWYREDVGTPIFRAWCKSKSRKGIYIKDEMIQEHINHLSKNITQQQMSDS
ncbi:hypothetical protein J6590_057067 [Homalodisca vitripennis]|nr:hypothetical protein J6590_057067 [Homalodisca vitripennis]